MIADRIKASIIAIARAAVPVDRLALYRARVVKQSTDLAKVDVIPDSPKLPNMSSVPLRHGVPGLKVAVSPGAYVLIGWMNGDGRFPYATLWEGGETTTKIVIDASAIYVGGETGAEPVPLGTQLKTWLNTHTHISGGPGYPTNVPSVLITDAAFATKAKAK